MEIIDRNKLYPIFFEPIYQERMWGGKKMAQVLNRRLPESVAPVGESWELVDRDREQSLIANGPLQGMSLHQLIETYGHDIISPGFQGRR
ncbi:MAG: hypothetical protein PHQ27_09925, partial [Victivallales bacterium]|nr:hypothetical protein [Victivallales bacterium]